MNTILITGSTGKLGSMVVDELIKRQVTDHVSIMARDLSKATSFAEKGITAIQGDYDDYASLVAAFKGIQRLYFVSGNDIASRAQQHENVVKAAQEAGVEHIIYTSFQRKSENNASPITMVTSAHLITELMIRQSGLNYSFLKHSLFAEVLPMFMGNEVVNAGMIYLPAAGGRASYTSRADMALAGVEVLLGEGHENKTYEISADKSYSFYDIAEILTELSGKEVKYNSPDVETFTAALLHTGVPHDQIKTMTAFCKAIAQGEFDFPDTTLERLIGRKPESMKDFLRKSYKMEEMVS